VAIEGGVFVMRGCKLCRDADSGVVVGGEYGITTSMFKVGAFCLLLFVVFWACALVVECATLNTASVAFQMCLFVAVCGLCVYFEHCQQQVVRK
jgi:hypothetical protein